MDRDEILKRAQSEREPDEYDERQKKINSKSFYWSYMALLISAFVFTLIKNQHGTLDYDNLSMVMYAAAAALLYRAIRDRSVKDAVFFAAALIGAVCFTVLFFLNL